MKKVILIVVMFLLTTSSAWANDTDNDLIVITVKESPAFVNKAGKVVKPSKSLENVCLSMKLAMLLRTDLGTGDALPQVTYFPMLEGVRVNHFDVLNNHDLTCNVMDEDGDPQVKTLADMLDDMDKAGVDVQVCWECWISRYGYPLPIDSSNNPVYGGYTGIDDLTALMNFLFQEKKAIQSMFNNADKVIDFD